MGREPSETDYTVVGLILALLALVACCVVLWLLFAA